MRYIVNRDAAQWRVVDGEAVVVNMDSSYYYGLNRSGTFVWTILTEQAASVDELAERVASEFGVETARARTDVEAVVRQLAEEHLVMEA